MILPTLTLKPVGPTGNTAQPSRTDGSHGSAGAVRATFLPDPGSGSGSDLPDNISDLLVILEKPPETTSNGR